MYNLLTGKYPFYDKSKDSKKIGESILKDKVKFDGSLNQQISNVAKNLIEQILVKDPKKRPGLNQILYHDFFHIGAFPRFLEISTLDKSPDLKYIKKYIPDADEYGIVNKEVQMTNLYRIIVNDIPKVKYCDLYKYSLDYNTPDINKIDYWLSFFHISSSGFCYYEVNNGMIGIMWKKNEEDEEYEGDKYLLNQKDEVFYKIKESNDADIIETYKTDEYPNELKEKMETFFKYNNKIKQKRFDYENQTITNTSESNTIVSKTETEEDDLKSENKESSINSDKMEIKEVTTRVNSELSEKNSLSLEKDNKIIYIKSFHNDKYGKFFVLSDDTKQIIFKDKINILISEKKETVGYIDRHKNVSFISLMNAMKNSSKDLISRLKYIKQVNYREIKKKMIKKIEENKNQYQINENNENDERDEESRYSDD